MENKNFILITVILGLLLLGVGGFYLYSTTIQNGQQNSQLEGKGIVVLGITDAVASMGNISSVLITINKAQIHSQTEGWVTLSSQVQQFDLLLLKQSGKVSMLAQAEVNTGTYDQMFLTVSKVIIVEGGVQKEAKLPSGELKILGDIVVGEDSTATAVFDFIVDESLHKTGNGLFIFTPVVKIETRSDASVQVKSGSELSINGGRVQANKSVGMDIDGQIKTNFKVAPDVKLEIISNIIKLTTSQESSASVKVTASNAVNVAVDGKYVDVAISVKLDENDGKKVWVVSGLKGIDLRNVIVSAETGVVVAVQ